jgi:hypothetical protein
MVNWVLLFDLSYFFEIVHIQKVGTGLCAMYVYVTINVRWTCDTFQFHEVGIPCQRNVIKN